MVEQGNPNSPHDSTIRGTREDIEQRRILMIRGGHNFRDLGGYTTQEGRAVKWRTLYRSGVMAPIDRRDVEELRGLGIVSICDLRTNSERRRKPTNWYEEGTIELVAHDYEMSVGVLQRQIEERQSDRCKVRRLMVETYRALPEEQANNYALLFRQLSSGRLPLVFNCSAGKDRTGVAAALVLSALGVPREQVIDDYLLTNESMVDLIDIMKEDPDFDRWLAEQPDVTYPLLRAEAEYLEAMFHTIETEYGGLQAYLGGRLGVHTAQVEVIKALLLE